ncbi:hypothetical protein [Myroides fluvii]|uniref:hypothetical protein n=1 Tax=Myroides fluvii TaxID=2572594 RepID=UPI00131D5C23|nr:hypothetical protein [Myroides fluvii]
MGKTDNNPNRTDLTSHYHTNKQPSHPHTLTPTNNKQQTTLPFLTYVNVFRSR